jgi:hypothetical protein
VISRLLGALAATCTLFIAGTATADFVYRQQTPAAFAPAPEFMPEVVWNFDGTREGWGGHDVLLTPHDSYVNVKGLAIDPRLRCPLNLAFDGAAHPIIRARVRRNDPGGSWQGSAYYQTDNHPETMEHQHRLASDPTVVGEWVVIEYDMRQLVAGGDDWSNSLIRAIRLDFNETLPNDFDIDWVAVGRYERPARQQ